MKKDSEKSEDILLYELEELREVKTKLARHRTRRTDIFRGTVLGLVLGVSGILFVQFFVPKIEAILIQEYKEMFIASITFSILCLVVIVFVSIHLFFHLTRYENNLLSEKSMDIIEYAIRRREYNIEQNKKSSSGISN